MGSFVVAALARRRLIAHLDLAPAAGAGLAGLERLYLSTPGAAALATQLQRAELPLSPFQFWLYTQAGSVVLGLVFGSLLGLPPLFALLLGFLGGHGGSRLFLGRRAAAVGEAFERQLVEVVRTLAASLQAGMTLEQGVALVAEGLARPAGPEFRRLAQALALGQDFEGALGQLAERVASREVNLFVTIVLLQRQVGGDLVAALREMAQTLHERELVRREAKASLAEQQTVAYLLPALPLVALLMFNAFMPGFLQPLLTPWGLLLLLAAGGLMALAFFLIRRLTRLEV